MPTNLQNVNELMDERISALWKNPENYFSFLETASRKFQSEDSVVENDPADIDYESIDNFHLGYLYQSFADINQKGILYEQ